MLEFLATALRAEGDEPPTEFRIFTAGLNVTEKGTGLFDAVAAAEVMRQYTAHAVDKMIDLEHLSLNEESNNFDPDARGWFKLELRDTPAGPELWAVDVTWTADGAERLKEKRQRYISPAFDVEKTTRRIVRVINVAITALPATHGTPALIAAADRVRKRTLIKATQKEENMALQGKDAEFAGSLLASAKEFAATAQDETLKNFCASIATACTEMLGEEAAAAALAAKPPPAEAPPTPATKPEDAEACSIAASVREITGATTPAEVATVLASYKKQASDLATEVASLKRKDEEREVREILASNRAKCTPALEAWALTRSPAEVATVLAAVTGVPSQVVEPAPAPGASTPATVTNEVVLTPEDEAVCAALHTDPKAFLAHKIARIAARGGK